MGDMVEMMLEGILCATCGCVIDDNDANGVPRNCDECEEEDSSEFK